tara:strand:- start:94 stop:657 length:564 start_codon:yes stop_codon:yes gene_type:complete
MAFKIPNFAKQMGGSPFAMKSPLKVDRDSQNSSSEKSPYERALAKDSNLPSYIKERKKHKPGSPEYNAAQNKINKAYGKGPTDRPTAKTKVKPASKPEEKTSGEHKPSEGVKVKTRKQKRAEKRVGRLEKKAKKGSLTEGQSKRLNRNKSKAKGEEVKSEDKTNVGKAIEKGVEKVKKVVEKKDKDE